VHAAEPAAPSHPGPRTPHGRGSTDAFGQQGPWTVVSLSGEQDVYQCARTRALLAPLPDQKRRHVVVDLSDVTFLDSSGLGVLVALLKRLRRSRGELRVVCPHPHLTALFRITGLNKLTTLYTDLAEATATEPKTPP
jgi:anti-sigma B factor antagonist